MTKLFSFFTALLIFSSSTAFARESQSRYTKNYVALSELSFDESGISFIEMHQGVQHGLKALRFESSGRYYYHAGSDEYWTCPKCLAENEGSYSGRPCGTCGFPIWN